MLIAASSLDITNQKDVINTLVERTGINTVAKKVNLAYSALCQQDHMYMYV